MTTQIVEKKLLVGSYAEASLSGQRADNQDRLTRFAASFGEVVLLADGMGGHRGGAFAADLTVRKFPLYLRELERMLPVREALGECARRVNRKVYLLGHEGDPALARMGSTIVVVALCFNGPSGELLVGNAGDSRAYLWRDGNLRLLTRDHTVANRLAEAGLLEADELKDHPESHVLTMYLGQLPDLSLDFANPIPLQNGDVVLVCSDGLSGSVPDQEIGSILGSAKSAEHAVQLLTNAALDRGSKDNISIQYVRVAEAVSEIHKGAQIGQYRLESFLGAGGMAQVWLGRHESLESLAAIKILDAGSGSAGEMAKRFLSEGRKQRALSHPAIVRVEGYSETPVTHLVLQYIDGESLHARIKRLGPERMAKDDFARIAFRVLDALEYAHNQKLIHRDVKSANILLDWGGDAYLGDFGLVVAEDDPRFTEGTRVMGTSEYMSPEHIRKPKQVDRRSDVYSLGCVLYEMLAGETPFAYHKDDFAMKLAHIKETPRTFRKLNPAVSPAVEAVVLRALEKESAARWQSCAEFKEALNAAIEEDLMPPAPAWTLRRFMTRYRVPMAAAAAILALVSVGTWLWDYRNQSTARELVSSSDRAFRRGERSTAALVALESLRMHRTTEGEDSLLRALAELGHPGKKLADRLRNTSSIAFSPDGRWLAAGDHKDIAFWEASSGKFAFKLSSPSLYNSVSVIAWSPDGRMLAAAAQGGSVIFDVVQRESQVLDRESDSQNIRNLTWEPDGAFLLGLDVSGGPAVIRIWDAKTGRQVRSLRHTGALSMSGVPGRAGFIVGTSDAIQGWDKKWRRIDGAEEKENGGVASIVFTPDGSRAALGSADNKMVLVREVSDDESANDDRLTVPCSANRIPGVYGRGETGGVLAWSPVGNLLACAEGRNIKIWDTDRAGTVDTGRLLQVFEAPDFVTSMAWSPDGSTIASASYYDGSLLFWKASFGPVVRPLIGHTGAIHHLFWTTEGQLVIADGDKARVWDADSGTLLRTITTTKPPDPPRDGYVVLWRARPDDCMLYAGGHRAASRWSDNQLRIWDVTNGQILRSTRVEPQGPLLGGSQDGRQLAWGSDGVWIRDAENNRVLFKLTDSSDSSVIWTSDGQRLATYRSGRGKSVQIYSAVDGSLQRKLSHDDRVMTVAWSPNGKDLATGSADHVVRIWDTRTGSLLRALYGHSAPVVSLAWSRDGRWLASGSGDNTARVWNVSTGELIHTIEAHTDTVTALAWSPDGRLATGSEDGLAKIWVLDPKVIEASACGYLSRNLSQGEWKELMPASFPYDPKHRTCSDLP